MSDYTYLFYKDKAKAWRKDEEITVKEAELKEVFLGFFFSPTD